MNSNPGKCPLCGGEKAPGATTFAVDLNPSLVVVRNVPALVCTQCGDAWIEDPVAQKLEAITEKARAKHAHIEVAQWQDVA